MFYVFVFVFSDYFFLYVSLWLVVYCCSVFVWVQVSDITVFCCYFISVHYFPFLSNFRFIRF